MLIHGYGQASALFFPILGILSRYFDIFLVDVVGMGCSSRPTDFELGDAATPEKVNEYFTEYLERWRLRMTHVLTRLFSPDAFYSALS